MLYGDDELFSLVRSAKLGHVELSPVLARMRDWIQDELGANVVHIVYDHIDAGKSGSRPRLNVILETDADYDPWRADVVTIRRDVKRRVKSKFAKIAAAEPDSFDTDNLLLVVDNFADECLGRACNDFLRDDAGQILEDFKMVPIWKIDSFSRYLVVFLMTERDIRLNTDNGVCALIADRCFEGVKRHDEFGYLTETSFRLKFDSKENLDRNYKGNLFYYWR